MSFLGSDAPGLSRASGVLATKVSVPGWTLVRGAVCLVFVGDVVTYGAGAYACDVFWKLFSGGDATAAVTNNDVGDLSLLTM